jgi:phosphohistidine phosphatase
MSARLVLMRHAKSDYPWGVEDHDRPLNERGRGDAPEIGAWLDSHLSWSGEPPRILVSTALRAQLTWSLASTRLSARWAGADVQDEPRIYEAEVGALQDLVAEQQSADRTLVIVGHNPGLAGLIDRVCIPDDLRARALAKFPTSSVAVLEAVGPLDAAIRVPGAMRVSAFAVPRG